MKAKRFKNYNMIAINMHYPKIITKFVIKLCLIHLILISSLTGFSQTTLFSDDFETDKGWTYSDWNRGETSFSGSEGYHVYTADFNPYTDNMNAIVTSPIIDLSGYESLYFYVDVRYDTEDAWDGFMIEYSDDGGSTWNTLGGNGDGVNWYNDGDVDGIANGQDGWSDDNGSWENSYYRFASSIRR
jgi:hypothetical protein